ncbi:MAG: ABC transporter permease [Acidimicrobiales bacterium]
MSDQITDRSNADDQPEPEPEPTAVVAAEDTARRADIVDAAPEPTYDAEAERRRIRAERRALLLKSPAFVVGAVILSFWIFCALFPGLLTTYGPSEVVRVPVLDETGEVVVDDDGDVVLEVIARAAPSGDAWFGTDTIGNDVYTRVIHGARPVLIVAPIAALLAAIAGTMLGLVMGYLKGWVDEVLSRILEAFLSIPVILLAIMTSVVFETTVPLLVITIAVLFTPIVARTVRAAVIAEAQLDYVTSARLRGESSLFIMTREILPNITTVVVVEFTVRVGYAIFTVATLSFLGFSAFESTRADWGSDVSKTYNLIQAGQWWPAIFPALAIASLVIAVNLIADSVDRVLKA